MSAPKTPYPVGYGKPPTKSQFKKGRSGNPAGRPKGSQNVATVLRAALGATVVVNEGGRRQIKTKLEVTVTQLVNKAVSGDLKAAERVLKLYAVLSCPTESTSVTPDLATDRRMAERLLARFLKPRTTEDSPPIERVPLRRKCT
jgi:uncharacterized protein DUF5681